MGNNYISLIYQVYIYILPSFGVSIISFTRTRIIHFLLMFKRLSDASRLPLASNLLPFKLHHSKFLWRNTHDVPCVEVESFWNRQREGTIVLSHIISVTSGANQRGFFSCVTNEQKQLDAWCLSLKSLRSLHKTDWIKHLPQKKKTRVFYLKKQQNARASTTTN